MTTTLQLRRGTAAQHTSFTGANGEVTVDTTNKALRVHDGVTLGGNLVGGASSYMNRVINGDMRGSSRGSVALTSNVGSYGGCDRWITTLAGYTGVSAASVVRGAFTPGTVTQSGYAQQITFNGTSVGGSSYISQETRIRASDVVDLGGRQVTFSCNIRHNSLPVGTFSYIRLIKPNVFMDWGNVAGLTILHQSASVVHATNVTTKLSMTTTLADTAASDGLSLQVVTITPSGTIVSGSNFLFLGDVRLELGDGTGKQDVRHQQVEDLLMKNYFENISIPTGFVLGSGYAVSTTVANITLPVAPKRNSPTVSFTGPLFLLSHSGSFSVSGVASTYLTAGLPGGIVQFTTTGMTAGHPLTLLASGGPVTISLNSEL